MHTAQQDQNTNEVDCSDMDFFLFKELIDYVEQAKNKEQALQPFLSDAEFLTVNEYLMYTETQIENIRKMFQSANFSKMETRQLYEMLSSIHQILTDSLNDRLELTMKMVEEQKNIEIIGDRAKAYVPRVVRLAHKLNLSEKEKKAFIYILVSQCGTNYPSVDISNQISLAAAMARFAGMNIKELLEFMSPERPYNKQGLIEIDSQYKDTLNYSIMGMQRECISALVGCEISSQDFLKIDKTALAEVLMEEPGFTLQGITNVDVNNLEKSGFDEDLDNEIKNLDAEIQQLAEKHEATVEKGEEVKANKKNDEYQADNDFDLYGYLREERSTASAETESTKKSLKNDENFLSPYTNDIEYIDDIFQLLATKIKIRNMENEKKEQESNAGFRFSRERNTDSILRELNAKERMLYGKCEKRLAASKFTPRLERLAKLRNMNEFEKYVLLFLVAVIISQDVNISMAQSYGIRMPKDINVGYILWILCDTLEERLKHRCYFYKKATLIKDGMIRLSDQLSGDLTDCLVSIDRRMLDYIVGLDSEFSEIVEGSNLYLPQVKLENVILPEEQKKIILDTVSNFDLYRQYRKRLGFDEIITYGANIVMLFFGESGCGKTLMANALASHLGKKLLLVNFSNLGPQAGDLLKFIFREAKINDALLFFDECETFFESRKTGGVTDVANLLTEIEKHDGLIIMATNRAYELDEAMHRRITLTVEFRSPDPLLRRIIWEKHIPEGIRLASDIDFNKLSMNYELTGGLIKNAVISALSFAVARDGKNPVIQQQDLERAAKLQMQGILQMNAFDRRIIPSKGLNDIVLPKELFNSVKDIISFEKARKILVGQWGFDERGSRQAMTILLHGPPGTGKSLCAEVIGFECGLPLKVVDITEILSRYTFNTSKNLETLFRETKKTGAILVIDLSVNIPQELERTVGLFSSLEHYNGMLIMTTNVESMLNDPILRKFKFVLEFPVPNMILRKELWRKLIPEKVPLSEDVKLDTLARDYEFTGRQIENCIFRACARSCLEPLKQLTMKNLVEACQEELKQGSAISSASMYR